MTRLKSTVACAMAALLVPIYPTPVFASSHREAPITALDRAADITDWYAFVNWNNPDRLVMILNVDPLLEPSNGPNYFPERAGCGHTGHNTDKSRARDRG
jgi:hypothetical protein